MNNEFEIIIFIIIISLILAYFIHIPFTSISEIFIETIKDVRKNYKFIVFGFLIFIITFISIFLLDVYFLDLNLLCNENTINNMDYWSKVDLLQKQYISNLYTKFKYFYDIFFVYLILLFISIIGYLIFKLKKITFVVNTLYILYLFVFIIPWQYEYGGSRAKFSSVKANMHVLQTALEIYSKSWNGLYPDDINILKADAIKNSYWKNIRNPYKGEESTVITFAEDKIKKYLNKECKYFRYSLQAGDIIYVPILYDDKVTKYYLYGMGMLNYKVDIIDHRGELFTLTNE